MILAVDVLHASNNYDHDALCGKYSRHNCGVTTPTVNRNFLAGKPGAAWHREHKKAAGMRFKSLASSILLALNRAAAEDVVLKKCVSSKLGEPFCCRQKENSCSMLYYAVTIIDDPLTRNNAFTRCVSLR
jgi:hypothetical protein